MSEKPNKPQSKKHSSGFQRIEDSYLLPTYLLPDYLGQTRPAADNDKAWERLKRQMARWRKAVMDEKQVTTVVEKLTSILKIRQ